MFSSIIGQENVIDIVRKEIQSGLLTNSMLFYGHQYTGKLSTALEIVRVLHCKNDRTQQCTCASCQNFRTLDVDNLVLLSRRNYYYETKELIETYRAEKSEYVREMIYKNIKLTFVPLQDHLIDGVMVEQDKKQIAKYGEKLSDFIDKKEYSSVELEEIEKVMEFFRTFYKTANIPVNMIRNMLNWTYISKKDSARIVIIDGIDGLEASSENILLKRLEEPAPNLYFILIARNYSKVLQTIRSRCRGYRFTDLSRESVGYILKNKYNQHDFHAATLYEFIHKTDLAAPMNIKQKLTKLINFTFAKKHTFSELYLFIEAEKDREIQKGLLRDLKYSIDRELLNREYMIKEKVAGEYPVFSAIHYENLKYISDELQKVYDRTERFNLNPKTQLEGIIYPLKEMTLHDKI